LGDELDLRWMSMNPLKVGTFTSGVFGADDLALLVGLHSQQLLVALGWQEVGPYRQSNDGALRWSSFQEERLGANGLSKITLSIAAWLRWYDA